MKSRTTASILAFFLGAFGIHRFYLSQTGLGILYLVFCWTGIPSVIGIIDCICFLLMSDEAFNQKYNLISIIRGTQQQQATTPNNNMNAIAINMGGQSDKSETSSSDERKKLYELKEKGIITQEEFDLKKKTIL